MPIVQVEHLIHHSPCAIDANDKQKPSGVRPAEWDSPNQEAGGAKDRVVEMDPQVRVAGQVIASRRGMVHHAQVTEGLHDVPVQEDDAERQRQLDVEQDVREADDDRLWHGMHAVAIGK
mmetsp:Transcript_117355/g.230256  ORF Transcript_117355/g.230256 Transcript_117355/m.230256 type:complete len:119 (+) Transcript_117355:430-786(+)